MQEHMGIVSREMKILRTIKENDRKQKTDINKFQKLIAVSKKPV